MATCLAPGSRGATPVVKVVFHRDLLCVWSHLVACRLESLRRQVGAWFTWRIRPFPLRPLSVPQSPKEIEAALRDIELARCEPDCPRIVSRFFTEAKEPGSGLVAMAAVEAAFFQSPRAGLALDARLRKAVFEEGLDVERLEYVMELARSLQHLGLDAARLSRDLGGIDQDKWRDRIVDRRGEAQSLGIERSPAVQIGSRLLVGACPEGSYGEAVFEALAVSVAAGSSGLSA